MLRGRRWYEKCSTFALPTFHRACYCYCYLFSCWFTIVQHHYYIFMTFILLAEKIVNYKIVLKRGASCTAGVTLWCGRYADGWHTRLPWSEFEKKIHGAHWKLDASMCVPWPLTSRGIYMRIFWVHNGQWVYHVMLLLKVRMLWKHFHYIKLALCIKENQHFFFLVVICHCHHPSQK